MSAAGLTGVLRKLNKIGKGCEREFGKRIWEGTRIASLGRPKANWIELEFGRDWNGQTLVEWMELSKERRGTGYLGAHSGIGGRPLVPDLGFRERITGFRLLRILVPNLIMTPSHLRKYFR